MTTPATTPGEHNLSTTDLAFALSVSAETIRRWSDQGLIPHRRTIGGHRRYSTHGLEVAAKLLGTSKAGNRG